jgi:hypothetical protein
MSNPIWQSNTNWRETGRQVRFGPLDGRLMIFVILLMLFPGKILLGITLLAIVFFYGLEYIGYTLPNAYRKMSVVIAGKKRRGVHYWRKTQF